MKHCLYLLLALCSTGCLHLHQEFVLADDNTGTFTVTGSVPKSLYETHAAQSRWTTWFDPATMGAICARHPAIELEACRVFQRNEMYFLRLEGKMIDAQSALASDILGGYSLRFEKDKTMSITLDLEGPKNVPDAPIWSPEKSTSTHIRRLTEGLRLDLTIHAPKRVISTTAPFKKGKAVRWVLDANKDPSFLENPPEIRLVAQ